MATSRVDEIVDRSIDLIVETGLARPEELVPATDADIARIEQIFGYLPRAYERFLRRIGGGAGHFLEGSQWQAAEVLFSIDSSPGWSKATWQVEDDAMLIASHQGYTGFYLVGREDDPPVMLFRESEPPTKSSDHFSAWFADMVRQEADASHQLDALRRNTKRARRFRWLRRLFT